MGTAACICQGCGNVVSTVTTHGGRWLCSACLREAMRSSVELLCRKHGIQNCIECPAGQCCDNLNANALKGEIARLQAREQEARRVIEGLYELATGTCYCKPRDTTGGCTYCAALEWLEGVEPWP